MTSMVATLSDACPAQAAAVVLSSVAVEVVAPAVLLRLCGTAAAVIAQQTSAAAAK